MNFAKKWHISLFASPIFIAAYESGYIYDLNRVENSYHGNNNKLTFILLRNTS